MSSSTLRALLVSFSVAACSCTLTSPLHANAQAIERSANGVTLHSSSGALHVAVCSERVIRVEASPTDEFPKSIVPTVIRPCGGASFTISSNASTVSIKTSVLKVEIDRATSSVRFLTAAGQPVLSEQPNGGRTIAPVDVDGMQTYEIRQDFLLSPDEALYGLGQHQEGFFNLRDIPIRLLQANTNICDPISHFDERVWPAVEQCGADGFQSDDRGDPSGRKRRGHIPDRARRRIRIFAERQWKG